MYGFQNRCSKRATVLAGLRNYFGYFAWNGIKIPFKKLDYE